MAERTEADLLVELGMTMTKMNRQLAAAEARFNRTATKIERDFNKANQSSVDRTLAATTRMEGAWANLGRVAGAALGIIIGQGLMQISANAGRAIKAMADLADQADRVGANLEEYQGLQFGFQLQGVENAEFVRGMEIFTQRIGEAAEGSGELYELLRKNDIAIRDQAGELRPVNDLLRDFADLIQAAGSESEQMALLNDAFGRSGRGLILAMQDGAAGLDAMTDAAHEAGVVLDEGLIRRAAELDDRLDVVKAQAQAMMNVFAVYGGEAVAGLAMMIEDIRAIGAEVTNLDAIMQGNAKAPQVLGEDVLDAMEAAGDATEEQAIAAQQLIGLYNELAGQATNLAIELELAADQAEALGRPTAAAALRVMAGAITKADVAFALGQMSGDDFNTTLTRTVELANGVLGPLQGIEGANFDSAAASIARLAIGLYDAAVNAATLRANLPTYTPTLPTGGPGTFPVGDNSGNFNSPTPSAPTGVPLPPSRPIDPDFGYYPSSGGGSPGGGSPGGGGAETDQGLSPWFTDEQEEQILDAYEALKTAQEEYNSTVEDGAMVVADLFTSIMDGSKSAEEAVADLLKQLAQVQVQRAFLGLAEGGGFMGTLFASLGGATATPSMSVPSFDGGGYTGSGARSGGMDGIGGFPALLHPNETVIDHTKASGTGGAMSINVNVSGVSGDAAVQAAVQRGVMQGLASYDRQLPGRVRQISGDRRAL